MRCGPQYLTSTSSTSTPKLAKWPLAATTATATATATDERVFKVECSYLEIYNEQVRDLLIRRGGGGIAASPSIVHLWSENRRRLTMLRVVSIRQRPYVEGLKTLAVRRMKTSRTYCALGTQHVLWHQRR